MRGNAHSKNILIACQYHLLVENLSDELGKEEGMVLPFTVKEPAEYRQNIRM